MKTRMMISVVCSSSCNRYRRQILTNNYFGRNQHADASIWALSSKRLLLPATAPFHRLHPHTQNNQFPHFPTPPKHHRNPQEQQPPLQILHHRASRLCQLLRRPSEQPRPRRIRPDQFASRNIPRLVKEHTDDAGIQTQLHHSFALLADRGGGVSKKGDSAVFSRAKHTTLVETRDAELADEEGQVARVHLIRRCSDTSIGSQRVVDSRN